MGVGEGTRASAAVPVLAPASTERDELLARVFPGDGEMARLCRAHDWAATPLGPVSGWSVALRTIVSALLESRHPMFLFWGPEHVQFYNDAYRPSLAGGRRHPGALGARGREFWTDIWTVIGPQIAQVMGGGPATWHENQYLPIERDGRLDDVWWTYSYSPARDDDGRVNGVLVVCQETTAHVLADRRLEAARRRVEGERALLEEVFRHTPSFLAVLRGPQHVFELVNDAYYQLVGHRALLGRPLLEALPEVRAQGFVLPLLDGVLATGEPYVGRETPILLARTPGAPPEERFVDFVYLPLVEADGTRSGIIAHGSDVTAQVRARQESERLLEESRATAGELRRATAALAERTASAERARGRTERLQAVTAALARTRSLDEVAHVVVEEMAEALGARTGAMAIRAADAEELVLVGQFGFPDAAAARVRRQAIDGQGPVPECFRAGAPVWVESRQGPDGFDARYPQLVDVWTTLGVSSAAFVPLVVAGETLGVISFSFPAPRPFSAADRGFLAALGQQAALAVEHARLFDAERAARAAAEAANRAKGEFLAVMSHELRTPLNAIGGYAELIELGIHGAVTSEQAAALGRIQRSQRHLLGLINGVLNYARVEAGAVHYALEDVPLDETLATCEALTAPQARARGLTLRFAGCDAGLTARADREKVQQIVLNLLTNAVKFTEPGGEVEVTCAADADRVTIAVRDTGRGIAPALQERVFEPFVQVDATRTRTQEGVGLGLAISRDLARGMGGELTVTSAVGAGSRFVFTLPRGG